MIHHVIVDFWLQDVSNYLSDITVSWSDGKPNTIVKIANHTCLHQMLVGARLCSHICCLKGQNLPGRWVPKTRLIVKLSKGIIFVAIRAIVLYSVPLQQLRYSSRDKKFTWIRSCNLPSSQWIYLLKSSAWRHLHAQGKTFAITTRQMLWWQILKEACCDAPSFFKELLTWNSLHCSGNAKPAEQRVCKLSSLGPVHTGWDPSKISLIIAAQGFAPVWTLPGKYNIPGQG